MYHEKRVGIDLDNLDYHNPKPSIHRYSLSKVCVGTSSENASPQKEFSVCPSTQESYVLTFSPSSSSGYKLPWCIIPLSREYTELFAGLSPEVTDMTGYAFPFGRFRPICEDLRVARSEAEGDVDLTRRFWEWSEKKVEEFV